MTFLYIRRWGKNCQKAYHNPRVFRVNWPRLIMMFSHKLVKMVGLLKNSWLMKIPNSARLSYALMNEADADLLFELDQDAEVMRYINGGKITTWQEVQDVFLPRMAKYRNPEKGWGLWKLTTTENNQFIGWVLVRPMDYFSDQPKWHDWELGWRLLRSAWGHGYATEAAKHLMQKLSDTQDIQFFSAIAMPGNSASIKIMQKLGMVYQKTDIYKDPLGDEEVVYYQVAVKPNKLT